ncbi:MAG TPA: FecR domain-containing protein [Chryseosolibacter sp.]|nr:FecR domain-containing protein [Chryseosolibacter sp.]
MTTEDFDGLIDRYLSGQASQEEEKLIEDFFHALERKDKISHYRLSEEMWSVIEQKVGSRKVRPTQNRAPVSRAARVSLRKILAAGVVCIAVAAGFLFYMSPASHTAAPLITSSAPKGQKSLITLADGSRIFLNSASSVSYPETFDSDKREITLTGEAFFEIARDERRPFIVRSADIVTRVLGTSFNIKSFEGEASTVTVATGRVEVEVASTSEDLKTRVVLAPGEQAVYDAADGLNAQKVDPFPAMAWKSQTLYFDNNTLEEVAAHLERWYNVTIDIEHDRIKNCRVNGQYKQMDLRSVLESIHYMYPIEYKFSNQNHVVLYGKGCDQ